jgi:hypothetical protein
MATLRYLKRSLVQKAEAAAPHLKQPLSDEQYGAGFDIFVQDGATNAYSDFIIPQLARSLDARLNRQAHLSVLEIGPGPESVLGHVPDRIRRVIKKYTAFEPNNVFASRLKRRFAPQKRQPVRSQV